MRLAWTFVHGLSSTGSCRSLGRMNDGDERSGWPGLRSGLGSGVRPESEPGDDARARPQPRLLDLLRGQLRMRHRSLSTERSYVGWVKRFIFFHEVRHPREMGKAEVEAFLNHLTMDLGVAASTQNQALNALIFLYRFVIDREIGELTELIRAKRPVRLPVVMTVDEVERVLEGLSGDPLTVALLLWGGRVAIDGGVAAASSGHRFRSAGASGARWEGAAGSLDGFAGARDGDAPREDYVLAAVAWERSCEGVWRGRVAGCVSSEISKSGLGASLAMDIPSGSDVGLSADGACGASSSLPDDDPATCEACGTRYGHHEAGHAPHISAQFRDGTDRER